MSTSSGWIKALSLVLVIILGSGILWFGVMLLMHLLMMGAPYAMGARMGVSLLVLILLPPLSFLFGKDGW